MKGLVITRVWGRYGASDYETRAEQQDLWGDPPHLIPTGAARDGAAYGASGASLDFPLVLLYSRRCVCNGSTLITEHETVRGDATALITNTVISFGETQGHLISHSPDYKCVDGFEKISREILWLCIKDNAQMKTCRHSIIKLLLIQESFIFHDSLNHTK